MRRIRNQQKCVTFVLILQPPVLLKVLSVFIFDIPFWESQKSKDKLESQELKVKS